METRNEFEYYSTFGDGDILRIPNGNAIQEMGNDRLEKKIFSGLLREELKHSNADGYRGHVYSIEEVQNGFHVTILDASRPDHPNESPYRIYEIAMDAKQNINIALMQEITSEKKQSKEKDLSSIFISSSETIDANEFDDDFIKKSKPPEHIYFNIDNDLIQNYQTLSDQISKQIKSLKGSINESEIKFLSDQLEIVNKAVNTINYKSKDVLNNFDASIKEQNKLENVLPGLQKIVNETFSSLNKENRAWLTKTVTDADARVELNNRIDITQQLFEKIESRFISELKQDEFLKDTKSLIALLKDKKLYDAADKIKNIAVDLENINLNIFKETLAQLRINNKDKNITAKLDSIENYIDTYIYFIKSLEEHVKNNLAGIEIFSIVPDFEHFLDSNWCHGKNLTMFMEKFQDQTKSFLAKAREDLSKVYKANLGGHKGLDACMNYLNSVLSDPKVGRKIQQKIRDELMLLNLNLNGEFIQIKDNKVSFFLNEYKQSIHDAHEKVLKDSPEIRAAAESQKKLSAGNYLSEDRIKAVKHSLENDLYTTISNITMGQLHNLAPQKNTGDAIVYHGVEYKLPHRLKLIVEEIIKIEQDEKKGVIPPEVKIRRLINSDTPIGNDQAAYHRPVEKIATSLHDAFNLLHIPYVNEKDPSQVKKFLQTAIDKFTKIETSISMETFMEIEANLLKKPSKTSNPRINMTHGITVNNFLSGKQSEDLNSNLNSRARAFTVTAKH